MEVISTTRLGEKDEELKLPDFLCALVSLEASCLVEGYEENEHSNVPTWHRATQAMYM